MMKSPGRWWRRELARPVGRFRMSLVLLLIIVVGSQGAIHELEKVHEPAAE